MHAGTDEVSSPQRKRARPLDASDGNMSDQPPSAGPGMEHSFVNDADAGDSAGEDDEDEGGKPADKKAGRRKIKIEFIQDKSRRHITFSKRKAGIMKKAYELSTLTGTQVLLLVVSETGLVYTFTTAKLQPLVTQPEGKNLIQACLNAPHGTLPNSMPVGAPLGRPANQIPPPPPSTTNGSTTTGSTVQSPANVMGAAGMNIRSNIAGGISIGGANAQSGVHNEDDDAHHHRDEDDDRTGSNRRRTSVVGGAAVNQQGPNAPKPTTRSPTSPHTTHLTAQQQQTQAQVQGAVAASQQQPVPNSPSAGSYTAAPPAYGQPGTGAPGSEMYPGVMHPAGTHAYPYAWPQNVAPPGYRRS